MRRIQAIELEDQPWLPASLRDATTDYLQTTLLLTHPYRAIAGRLRDALDSSGQDQIVDLGAGAGGPWLRLLPLLSNDGRALRVLLTDKFPNVAALDAITDRFPQSIVAHDESVDATRVPSSLHGFRTMFSSFHHFPPDLARGIIADAVRQGQGIGIFEATQRSAVAIGGMAVTPLVAFLLMPLARPFRWSSIFWTYVLPLHPLAVLFDGVVSCLRTYTPAELQDLVDSIPGAQSYVWQIGEDRDEGSPIPVTYLIGYPRRDRSDTESEAA